MITSVNPWITCLCAWVVLIGVPAVAGTKPQERDRAERDHECAVCHFGVGDENAPKLKATAYRTSAHASTGCVGCHVDIEGSSLTHEEAAEDLAPVDCVPCHEDAGREHRDSLHFPAKTGDSKTAPISESGHAASCADCHGSHDVRGLGDPGSRVRPANQVAVCGRCHTQQRRSQRGHPMGVLGLEPTRGALPLLIGPTDPNLLVAVACTDCHDSHAVRSLGDPGSSLSPERLSGTCGRCHENARDAAAVGAHAVANGRGDPASGELPVCTSCHTVHASSPVVADACGRCHEAQQATYAESYHGRRTDLGDATVAQCWDCHGAHTVLSATDPKSPTHTSNKVASCQKCHEGASDRLGGFWPHADPGRPAAYPALAGVRAIAGAFLLAALAFVGLHTFARLWRRGGTEPPEALPGGASRAGRTTPSGVRLVGAISVGGLMVSGGLLSLAHDARVVALLGPVGGAALAELLHQGFGYVLLAAIATHLALALRRLQRRAYLGRLDEVVLGKGSTLPRIRDLRDLAAHCRWLVGVGPKPPWVRLDSFEKLEFWAVLLAVLVLSVSGLVLRFPSASTALVPGWLLNVATVLHSREALLGLGVLLGLHALRAHLGREPVPEGPMSPRPEPAESTR